MAKLTNVATRAVYSAVRDLCKDFSNNYATDQSQFTNANKLDRTDLGWLWDLVIIKKLMYMIYNMIYEINMIYIYI